MLTTGETLRLAEGFVQVKALGPVVVRGLADPVEVFELVGAASTRTRLQAFAARGLTRFVGRQAEIEALRQALERAGTRHGQVVGVIGEPGVGKTRLCYEFIRSHHTHDGSSSKPGRTPTARRSPTSRSSTSSRLTSTLKTATTA